MSTPIDSNVGRRACPVCGVWMWHDDEVMDNVLMAAGERCPNNCYEYEMQFGATRVRVLDPSAPDGFREWVWAYTDSRKQIDEYERQIKAACLAAR